MASTYKGACQCGIVNWSVPTDKVTFTAVCHCYDCQASSGSSAGSTSLMVYDFQAVKFISKDAIKARHSKSERGRTTARGFCDECGTPIYNHVSEGEPDEHYALRTGTMGEAARSLKIDKEIFMKSKLSWVPTVTASSSQQFDAMPPE